MAKKENTATFSNEKKSSAENGDMNKTGINEESHLDSSVQPNVKIEQAVQQLLDNYAATPEKLEMLIQAEEKHKAILQTVNLRLAEIQEKLSPKRDAIEKGLAKKLSFVERSKLMTERKKLLRIKRKLQKSDKIISIKIVEGTANERRQIHIEDLRDKVKEPGYYNKYGKHIVPSFEKWLQLPMSVTLRDKLVEIKSLKAAAFNDSLAKLLLYENPSLYIRSTGNKDLRAGYFADFKKIFDKWQPNKAVMKS
jgi:hypothetical protein